MRQTIGDRAFKARCRCRQTHFFPPGFSDSQVAKLLGVQADRLAFSLREEAWMASRARCQSSFESCESSAKVTRTRFPSSTSRVNTAGDHHRWRGGNQKLICYRT